MAKIVRIFLKMDKNNTVELGLIDSNSYHNYCHYYYEEIVILVFVLKNKELFVTQVIYLLAEAFF